jgi:hypothetical protein
MESLSFLCTTYTDERMNLYIRKLTLDHVPLEVADGKAPTIGAGGGSGAQGGGKRISSNRAT